MADEKLMASGGTGRVFVATTSYGSIETKGLDLLRAYGFDVNFNKTGTPLKANELKKSLEGAVGVIAGVETYDADVLSSVSSLRVISRCGSGTDAIDLAVAAARGIRVLNTPDASTQSVTELTLGLILGLLRFISESDREVRSGLWRKRTGFLLEELTFGIVGLGRIGRNLAEILKRMGARVIGHDAQCDKNWSDPLGISCMPMVDVLKNADVVSLHLPLVPGLLHCIGAHELSLMKKGSFIVNTARGGLVDEKALFDSLAQGYLGGAALDVFEREPYEGPLRNLPNVILTPHIGSYARRSRARMELEAAQNLVNALTEMDLLGSRASQFYGRVP